MLENKTIFDVISQVTSRVEPFHSQTLAYFLANDPVFRGRFLDRFVPQAFRSRHSMDSGVEPVVTPEDVLPSGDRIDVTLRFESALLGVEVKTSDASTTVNQLNRYWEQLQRIDDYQGLEFQLIYLSPFSRANLPTGVAPEQIHAIAEFERFQLTNPGCATHCNWAEVASLYPSESQGLLGGIYFHHKRYIEDVLCDPSPLRAVATARELGIFLGDEVVTQFFSQLHQAGVTGQDTDSEYVIPLKENCGREAGIVQAIRVLLDSGELSRAGRDRRDEIERQGIKEEYQEGPSGAFYRKLFRALSAY